MTKKQQEKLVRECYENFPESSLSMSCRSWKYEAFDFLFVDDEGESHRVRLPDAVRGLRLFRKAVESGELPGLDLPAGYLQDTGTWDAVAFDALNQMVIFGEVVYG